MAKEWLEVHQITTEIYKVPIRLVVGDFDSLSYYLSHNFPEIDQSKLKSHCGEVYWISRDNGANGLALIWLYEKDIYALNHECLHAAQHILDLLGVNYIGDNTEALVYFHEYIFKSFREKMLKKKRPFIN